MNLSSKKHSIPAAQSFAVVQSIVQIPDGEDSVASHLALTGWPLSFAGAAAQADPQLHVGEHTVTSEALHAC